MVNFDVITGMDWLSSDYATVDCRVKIAQYQCPGKLVLERKGNNMMPGKIYFVFKAQKLITKG